MQKGPRIYELQLKATVNCRIVEYGENPRNRGIARLDFMVPETFLSPDDVPLLCRAA
ncbi:hypothetical protein FOMPIDRAFT_159882 [Fomitopsis schrenkii]|uniref:Uncharacterized protein n=1 Tax=Fomitopsis schrenkii TaxID=2126942 RepID=S8E7K5_FOMSC|nr:hypothetical protein FOMPIDRAFT_159882 [Fomitopsis schrenkii]